MHNSTEYWNRNEHEKKCVWWYVLSIHLSFSFYIIYAKWQYHHPHIYPDIVCECGTILTLYDEPHMKPTWIVCAKSMCHFCEKILSIYELESPTHKIHYLKIWKQIRTHKKIVNISNLFEQQTTDPFFLSVWKYEIFLISDFERFKFNKLAHFLFWFHLFHGKVFFASFSFLMWLGKMVQGGENRFPFGSLRVVPKQNFSVRFGLLFSHW